MVDTTRRRFLRNLGIAGVGAAAGYKSVDELQDGSERYSRGEYFKPTTSYTDQNLTEEYSLQEFESEETTITIQDCLERREVTRGEEHLECSSARENRNNITDRTPRTR